jgi:hypothetical protein
MMAATKNRPCIVFALVWRTKVIVVIITVHAVMILVWSRIAVTSENLQFILSIRHQWCRHFTRQIGLYIKRVGKYYSFVASNKNSAGRSKRRD